MIATTMNMTTDNPVIETCYGPARGRDDGRTKAWHGIRYAAPPVGELRWRAPRPPEPWSKIADATRPGFVCPQPPDPAIPMDLGAPQHEDCLTLNVWASSDTKRGDAKPVMVWVHGGAYIFGSASQPLYYGDNLAAGGDVMVVTINYRVGALGFLDLSSFSTPAQQFDSNIGLRDVIAALRWVRDNIDAFGGDPDRVTLFGESAGGLTPGTLAFAPIVDGDLVPDYPGDVQRDRRRAARRTTAYRGAARLCLFGHANEGPWDGGGW